MTAEFTDVTELAGTEISAEQLERMVHRYTWAAKYCQGKDILEVACGSGQGLGVLLSVARSVEAGDISEPILNIARTHYGDRVRIHKIDAEELPFANSSKDVVLMFEAIYYLRSPEKFIEECRRILRPGGKVLIASANPGLPDFNPSPHSFRYFKSDELRVLFANAGFATEVYGYFSVGAVSLRQRLLRPVKRLAVALGLIPKTMAGKKLLKRLVFGKLVRMPAELPGTLPTFAEPVLVGATDTSHKVLYVCASLADKA